MITRSKLVEQLRDYQIRSQQKYSFLVVFSPKPHIASRADVFEAIFWAFMFGILVISSYMAIHLKQFRLSFIIICLGILLPYRMRLSRQAAVRKRERRLPLSM